jgi:hypothetical protein
MCPYRIGERVRALKLLRSVQSGMLLMWDRGLHSYEMVQTTVSKGCDYLGRIPANVKFLAEKPLEDGSYLSWINPSGKLRSKGCQAIRVRVIEYTIEQGASHFCTLAILNGSETLAFWLLLGMILQKWDAP